MSKCIFVGIVIFGYIVNVFGENMIGPGKWKIYHTSFKKGEINDMVIDLQQKMLNRTHYVYSGKIIAVTPINEELAIKIDVCKFVDGGCKQYQVITDNSLITFVNKFAEDNVRVGFELMGVDPPQLPLPAGEYSLENYIFDMEKLPEEFTYGHFIADVCALRMGIAVGCVTYECEFYEADEECDD